jgi:hypothetical protein
MSFYYSHHSGATAYVDGCEKLALMADTVPDVDTFLTKIGRDMHKVASAKITEWPQLFTLSAHDLKEAGLTPRQRKYLLLWREKYRQGEELEALPVMRKKYGGERKRKAAGK